MLQSLRGNLLRMQMNRFRRSVNSRPYSSSLGIQHSLSRMKVRHSKTELAKLTIIRLRVGFEAIGVDTGIAITTSVGTRQLDFIPPPSLCTTSRKVTMQRCVATSARRFRSLVPSIIPRLQYCRQHGTAIPAAELLFGQPLHETHPHLLQPGERKSPSALLSGIRLELSLCDCF